MEQNSNIKAQDIKCLLFSWKLNLKMYPSNYYKKGKTKQYHNS